LAGIAGERGLDELTAQVLSRNEAMLRIFRRAGATCITAPDTFGTTVVLELPGRDRRATVTGRTVRVDHVNSKKRQRGSSTPVTSRASERLIPGSATPRLQRYLKRDKRG
jgi:hypothetical protein